MRNHSPGDGGGPFAVAGPARREGPRPGRLTGRAGTPSETAALAFCLPIHHIILRYPTSHRGVNVRELDRRAMAVTAGLIPAVTPQHWQDPTPCAGWRVADLLAHIIGAARVGAAVRLARSAHHAAVTRS